MKYIIYLFLAFIFCSSVVLGQNSTPPPPLIYKSPEKELLKEFVSEDKSFHVTFPGTPTIAKQEISNVLVTIHKVYRQGSGSVVNTYDFAANIETNKEKVYEVFKNSLLRNPDAKIEAEKDIQFNNLQGKEFDVLNNLVYQKIRLFILGSRLYEIKNDVTNWHTIGDSTKKDFFIETKRFFDSFKVLEK